MVTCVSHAWHNCAIKANYHFEDVDQLITTVKSATVKNKTRQAKFAIIDWLPQPVVTGWESWLNAAL